ncbi:MAG: hypothetical protein K1000chlam3_01338 [Chlamydiae bacterium]|nr:hypothetical protein [Chlamydiota bacterium]
MNGISFYYISRYFTSNISSDEGSQLDSQSEAGKTAKKTNNLALKIIIGICFVSIIFSPLGFYLFKKMESDQKISETKNKTHKTVIGEFEEIDPSKEKENIDPNLKNAIESLKSRKRLSNNTVMKVLDHFGVFYVKEFIAPKNEVRETMESVLSHNKNPMIYIPIVVEGTISDHIVLFTIDRPKKLIEFYDSQGNEINKRKLIDDFIDKRNLEQIAKKIQDVLPEYKLKINENEQQKILNIVDCGAFVLRYVQERRERTFEEICADEKIDIKGFRKDLADILSLDQKSA